MKSKTYLIFMPAALCNTDSARSQYKYVFISLLHIAHGNTCASYNVLKFSYVQRAVTCRLYYREKRAARPHKLYIANARPVKRVSEISFC